MPVWRKCGATNGIQCVSLNEFAGVGEERNSVLKKVKNVWMEKYGIIVV